MTNVPLSPKSRRGFALVLSLAVMALLVLVVLTLSGFLSLESRVADASLRGALARHNALMSARLALAQLQLLAGPDQRVTATAGILDAADTTWGPAPTNPNHAFLTGVWHAGTKADGRGRHLAPLQRSANGYLYDTRFSEDRASGPVPGSHADGKPLDWSTDRERTTADSRLLGWLVSGNEGLALSDPAYVGPRSPWTVGLRTRIPLLGAGSAGLGASGEGTLAAPTGRVELPPVPMPGPDGFGMTGRYAWWVGDEGVKARANLPDPYAGLQPDASDVTAGGYYRLMTSQRNNLTLVKDKAGASPFSGWDAANAATLANAADFRQLEDALGLAASSDLAQFYHDVGFRSLGLHTDTQRGGLRRDLTAYLNLGGSSPVAAGAGSIPGVDWSPAYRASAAFDAARPMALPGVDDTADILGDLPWVPHGANTALNVWGDGKGVSTSPKYGLIRSWYMQKAAWGTAVAASLPVQRPSTGSGGVANDQNYAVSSIRSQYRTPVHPVLSQFNVWFRPAYDTTVGPTARAYMLVYPRVVLWNPWNVPISSQAYVVDVGHRFVVRARVDYTVSGGGGVMVLRYGNNANVNHSTSDYNATQWNPGLSAMAFVVPATDFKPGEALVFTAPADNKGEMGTSVTRPYAASGTQVLAPAPLASSANPTPYFKATIRDIPSDPANPADFVTNARAGLITSATCNFATGPGGGYDFSLQYNVLGAPYGSYANMTGQTFLLDGSGANAYQAVDTDPYIRSNMGRWISQSEAVAMGFVNLNGADPTLAPGRMNSINYRLKWFDEPGGVGPQKLAGNILIPGTNIGWGQIGANRSYQLNHFVQNNPRAPRHFRNPFDLCIWRRSNHDREFGTWTLDRDPLAMTDNQYAPLGFSGRSRGAPFCSSTNVGASHVYTLYDLPNAALGILSLGQLQHVPFAQFSWQPSIAFGNGYADPNSPAHTTAYGLEAEMSWPVAANRGSTSPMTISGQGADLAPNVGKGSAVAGGTAYFSFMPAAAYQKDEITAPAYYIHDLAFELNTALWDSWFVSGIPAGNGGWASPASPWDVAATWPNARVVPLGTKQPPSGLPTLYHASVSTAMAGAFNVNSTSVRAWTAFLSAQRNLRVPSALAGSDSSGTPFLRNLLPQQGKVQGSLVNATFHRNTWGGYRSLTDAEIAQLATAIVAEVRRRGPFLSMADFVNRRLRPVGFDPAKGHDAGDLTDAAYTDPANMGALQAGIDVAALNTPANFGTPLDSSPSNLGYDGTGDLIQRDNAADFTDPFDRDPKSYHPRGEARVAHRAAGAPGYLMQSDILQQLAPAMTVRSDTFTIRAYGQAADAGGGRALSEAWCEMVVQRMPQPCVPETDSLAAGVNPRSNHTVGASGNRTYQRVDLGRRFRVVQFRWLRPDEV